MIRSCDVGTAEGPDHRPGVVRHRGPRQRPQRRRRHHARPTATSWNGSGRPMPGSPRARARSTRARRPIRPGGSTSARRPSLGCVEHHCGELSVNKRLPDFLFRLPTAYLQHAFDELMRTDGTRKTVEPAGRDGVGRLSREVLRVQDDLAAAGRPGRHAGDDAGLRLQRLSAGTREGRAPPIVSASSPATGKRGGRHTTFEARLHEREVVDEWVYDIECAGLHNFVCGVGNVVCHNTNEPEYRRLQNNEFMEALRDRTVKIDVPYVTRLQGRDQDLREGLQHRARQGQAHRPAHDRDRGHVGGADAAGAAQARQPDAAAEAQALQRQDAARLHRGQRRRAEARGGQRGHARHQPALHPGQDQQRHRRSSRRGLRQPVHGAARTGSRPAASLADHQPGAVAALPRTARRW